MSLKAVIANETALAKRWITHFSVTEIAPRLLSSTSFRRRVATVSWEVAFSVTVPLSSVNETNSNTFAFNIAATLQSASFLTEVTSHVSTVSEIDHGSITTVVHTRNPSWSPTIVPTSQPTVEPTFVPTTHPSLSPTSSKRPTVAPTLFCEPGYHYDNNTNACYQCLPGRFADNNTKANRAFAHNCKICEPGKYTAQFGSTKCMPCEKGALSAENRVACRSCEAGEFSFQDKECLKCPAGRFAPTPQTDVCLECLAGSSTNNVSRGATSCTPCNSGKFSNGSSVTCTKCSAGKASPNGQSSCSACRQGTFSETSGASRYAISIIPFLFMIVAYSLTCFLPFFQDARVALREKQSLSQAPRGVFNAYQAHSKAARAPSNAKTVQNPTLHQIRAPLDANRVHPAWTLLVAPRRAASRPLATFWIRPTALQRPNAHLAPSAMAACRCRDHERDSGSIGRM